MCTLSTFQPLSARAKAPAAAGIGMSPWHAGRLAAGYARLGAYRNDAPRGSEDVPTR